MPESRDLPLFRWGAALRQARHTRRQRCIRLGFGFAGVVLLGVTIVAPPVPRLVWNVSASAPEGLYRVAPEAPLALGDMVVARMPANVRQLAARRRYLPTNVPLVKRVAAVPGDGVCALGPELWINERPVALRRSSDGAGRPMPGWAGCRSLGRGDYLLLMAASDSFDGRYFGPTNRADILGRAIPLWTR